MSAYQYPQQPPAPPRRRKRKSNTLLVVLVTIMGCLIAVIGLATIWGITHPDKPADTRQPGAATPNPSEARPGIDAGAGTPGAPCATNRLGYFFVKDGVTYTCKGPAPYRWLQ